MSHIFKYRGTIAEKSLDMDIAARRWLHIIPDEAIGQKMERDGDHFHMTIVTSMEMSDIDRGFDLRKYCEENPITHARTLGLASVEKNHLQSWYLVMYSPWADQLRHFLGLVPRTFHVTLAFLGGDLYGAESLFQCISVWEDRNALSSIAKYIVDSELPMTPERGVLQELVILRYITNDLLAQSGDLLLAHMKLLRSIAVWCISHAPAAANDLVLDIGYTLFNQGLPYGLKLVLLVRPDIAVASSLSVSFPQCVLSSAKFEMMVKTVHECNILLFERSKAAHRNGSGPVWSYNDKVFALNWGKKDLDLVKVPRNFSWARVEHQAADERLWPYLLAGSALPTSSAQVVAMRSVGIRHIITVHEEQLPVTLCPTLTASKASAFELSNLASPEHMGVVAYHFTVVDRTPPSLQQLEDMCMIIDGALTKSEGVLVHCQGGVGRTNTVIIAYLMKSQNLSVADATAQVTAQRKIILSQSQKVSLNRWWVLCNSARNIALDVQEPLHSTTQDASFKPTGSQLGLYRKVASALNLPPLIVLCGLAASGKSTFADTLASFNQFFVRINKDEMRGKGQCENALFDAITAINSKKGNGRKSSPIQASGCCVISDAVGAVIIDCCNLSAAKRKEWIELAHHPRAWCIYFAIPLIECKKRIQARSDHPTIKSGEAGVRILDSMQRMLEIPTPQTIVKEGFERLIVLNNEEDVAELLRSWKISFALPSKCAQGPVCSDFDNSLLKFPRTAHIMNLGAATRDDKICGRTDLAALVDSERIVTVEEKLDGANMGIFIHSEEMKIMVQNRSHFISSKYHAQFSPLDHWLQHHTADLWSILIPGRHILYGEWLYATHSVKYTHLPGWFVAYDLYDRATKTFVSREVLATLLSTTNIPHVPLIYEGSISTLEELTRMITGTSKYNRTEREGIVVRVCKHGTLQSRAKLVRADFIAGNERWNNAQKLEVNSLAAIEF